MRNVKRAMRAVASFLAVLLGVPLLLAAVLALFYGVGRALGWIGRRLTGLAPEEFAGWVALLIMGGCLLGLVGLLVHSAYGVARDVWRDA